MWKYGARLSCKWVLGVTLIQGDKTNSDINFDTPRDETLYSD